ncbi:hypothetical protein N7493_005330 [Penicillium malachiteum]|uniref:NADP-dependent oxidoreductase domain-containing protein n=1 Tax=Penicillium malachiteum TaxID=1324776 RepID=A0AAD6HMG7_9EURO|nr:hypothetical protein N7493_005330 [Penicillium malachiteum]
MFKNKEIIGRTVPIEHGHEKPAPKMQYVRLGNSGLKARSPKNYEEVSRLIFGTATYGIKSDVACHVEKEEALTHLQSAWELGFNTFNTSNFYCNGVSEEILGEFIKTVPREAVVIMTKASISSQLKTISRCHFPVGDSAKTGPAGLTLSSGSNRKHIFDNVKAALKRLQTDYMDVMQIEETMQALHDVVQAD